MESCSTLPNNRVMVCVGVNGTVQQNSFLNGSRVFFVFFSLDAIGYEVSDDDPFVISGKIDMCQKVHDDNLRISVGQMPL